MYYARNNIITPEMEYCAIRENENRESLLGKNFKEEDHFYYWYRIKKEAQIIARQRNKKESLNYIKAEFEKLDLINNKVLFDKKGVFVDSFSSMTKPDSAKLLKVIEEKLDG